MSVCVAPWNLGISPLKTVFFLLDNAYVLSMWPLPDTTTRQVYQPTGPKAMQDGMIEVKERHAFVVFFKTDESGFVPVGQVC